MANRSFSPAKGYLEKGLVILECVIMTTTSGTVDTTVTPGKGIKSVTRNSAGDYTIVLQDPYVSLLHAIPSLRSKSDGTAPAANKGTLLTTYGATNFGAAPTAKPSLHVAAWLPNLAGAAAVAADVSDASAIHVTLVLKDSTV